MTISKKRLRSIQKIKDDQIDYSDIPKTDAAFWASAELKLPQPKKGVYLRIDHDVLKWFQKAGTRYQTRMNAVLRSYMDAHKSH